MAAAAVAVGGRTTSGAGGARSRGRGEIALVVVARRRFSSAEMESTLKGIRGCDAPGVLDMDDAATVGGGVGDTYGEDCATEDQLVTPWTVSVAR